LLMPFRMLLHCVAAIIRCRHCSLRLRLAAFRHSAPLPFHYAKAAIIASDATFAAAIAATPLADAIIAFAATRR